MTQWTYGDSRVLDELGRLEDVVAHVVLENASEDLPEDLLLLLVIAIAALERVERIELEHLGQDLGLDIVRRLVAR
jgi:hypothetical protein